MLLIAAALFISAARADAATLLIFDTCSEPSLCGTQVHFNAVLQPGGYVSASLAPQFNIAEVIRYGINSTATAMITSPRTGVIALGPGSIGPFGSFDQLFEGAPFGMNFDLRDPFSPFTHELDPLFLNSLGFSMAAEIRDRRTGVTGFIATGLNDMTPVPEPASMLLLGTGLLAAARAARKRREN